MVTDRSAITHVNNLSALCRRFVQPISQSASQPVSQSASQPVSMQSSKIVRQNCVRGGGLGAKQRIARRVVCSAEGGKVRGK